MWKYQLYFHSYLHCTPAQFHHLKQHHVFHAILLVVAIYPACSLPSFAFLPCCFLPLLSTLQQKKGHEEKYSARIRANTKRSQRKV